MHSRTVRRFGSGIPWWRMRCGHTLAGAVSAGAAVLLLVTGCSTVPESNDHLPVSPPQQPQAYGPTAAQTQLQIMVNFLSGPKPSDGGSASVQRADSADAVRCGVSPCLVAIGYQESVGFVGGVSLPTGAYVVTYQPPGGYRLADNVMNPQTVTIATPLPPRMVLTFTATP